MWTDPPDTVLVLRKQSDSHVTGPFCDMIAWLAQETDIIVFVEEWNLSDVSLETNDYFLIVKQQLQPFDKDDEKVSHEIDLVICLGGDRTLLHASSLFQGRVPPVMAFNVGSRGFLTPFQYGPDFRQAVLEVMKGSPPMILRYRLDCVLNSGGQPGSKTRANDDRSGKTRHLVLNEVVLNRRPSSTLSCLEVYIGDRHVTTVQGDGLIVSSPTGSTAYSVSAGASMVHPGVPCMLLTPVCPHSLSFRPVIVPAGVKVKVRLCGETPDVTCMVCFDGRHSQEMRYGEVLEVATARHALPSICPTDQTQDWFDSLTACLQWNNRKAQKPLALGRVSAIRRSKPDNNNASNGVTTATDNNETTNSLSSSSSSSSTSSSSSSLLSSSSSSSSLSSSSRSLSPSASLPSSTSSSSSSSSLSSTTAATTPHTDNNPPNPSIQTTAQESKSNSTSDTVLTFPENRTNQQNFAYKSVHTKLENIRTPATSSVIQTSSTFLEKQAQASKNSSTLGDSVGCECPDQESTRIQNELITTFSSLPYSSDGPEICKRGQFSGTSVNSSSDIASSLTSDRTHKSRDHSMGGHKKYKITNTSRTRLLQSSVTDVESYHNALNSGIKKLRLTSLKIKDKNFNDINLVSSGKTVLSTIGNYDSCDKTNCFELTKPDWHFSSSTKTSITSTITGDRSDHKLLFERKGNTSDGFNFTSLVPKCFYNKTDIIIGTETTATSIPSNINNTNDNSNKNNHHNNNNNNNNNNHNNNDNSINKTVRTIPSADETLKPQDNYISSMESFMY